jgi:hypothetical protein
MGAAHGFSVVLGMFLVAQSGAADVWTTPIPLLEVNSSAEEWSPFLSHNGLTLYFARVRSCVCYYGRIWEAIRDTPSGPFNVVQEVPGELNAVNGHVVCGWISPDSLRMYYHTEINGVFALQVSERCSVYDAWPAGIPLPGLEGLGRRLQMPRLTRDEKTVIFDASDLSGGQGGYDLWMATRPHLYAPFENVANVQELNTPASELPGSISSDGLTLYFSSNRDGNQALFRATRETPTSPFGPPVHLSFFDVPDGFSMHPGLANDGSALYFMAQQGSDPTTRDIWVSYAPGPIPAQPELPLPLPEIRDK